MKHYEFDVTHDECEICQFNLRHLVGKIVTHNQEHGLLSCHDSQGEWHGAWMRLTRPRKTSA